MKTPRPSSVTILQVEDDVSARARRSEALRLGGFRVTEAADAHDALRIALLHRPHVVVCGVELADMSGFMLTRRMRALHPEQPVPVILVSREHRDDASRQASIYCGASEYLVEPLTGDDLVAAVRRALEVK